jgi:type VI secretion system Hcp family effector
MASAFLLTVKGTKQGDIKGSSTKKDGALDFSKGMECHGFSYAATTQFDPNSGHAAGKRTHQPIRIVREVDSASPKFFQALVTNEVFTTVKLQFGKAGPGGKPPLAHTIELTNAVIVSIKPGTPSGKKRCENITLTYEDLRVNGMLNGTLPRLS